MKPKQTRSVWLKVGDGFRLRDLSQMRPIAVSLYRRLPEDKQSEWRGWKAATLTLSKTKRKAK